MKTQVGLEGLRANPLPALSGRRLGLLLNQASVDTQGHLACDVIDEVYPGQLVKLFSPQHGLWGEQQANMRETPHGHYDPLDLPVMSLYSETRRPSAEMLADIDCLVVDLQDVGTRVYTFVWTLLECMLACAEHQRSLVVLDRPNPLGGTVMEGPDLDRSLFSFVGGAAIPLRHGLTMAELARLFAHELHLELDLSWVPLQHWRRGWNYWETGRAWNWPSPNMPTVTTALLYPGMVLWEGINLSEGRGTTRPFEVVGAPFLDARSWLERLQPFALPGLQVSPTRFVPTFDKWADQRVCGLDLRVVDPQQVRSVATSVALLLTAAALSPGEFKWLDPPYEYDTVNWPIDILFGNGRLREAVTSLGETAPDPGLVESLISWDEASWRARIEPILLYH